MEPGCGAPRHMACSCQEIGTKVGFTLLAARRTFLREQTWGRAVRASHNSREFGALLIWGRFSAVSMRSAVPDSRL